MERLRRLHWNERTVPPERARRLIGIRRSRDFQLYGEKYENGFGYGIR